MESDDKIINIVLMLTLDKTKARKVVFSKKDFIVSAYVIWLRPSVVYS